MGHAIGIFFNTSPLWIPYLGPQKYLAPLNMLKLFALENFLNSLQQQQ